MGVDVATIGETMVLLVPELGVQPEEASTFHRRIGGAESNVAITLARLGLKSSWHSALGEDAFGHYIAQRIASEGVHCYARKDSGRHTGLYLKEIRSSGTTVRYYRQGSAASELTPKDIEDLTKNTPNIVHTTGITPALSTANRDQIFRLWKNSDTSALKSFDLNYRPALHNRHHAQELQELANLSDIVFCGDDEAHSLWGTDGAAQIRDILDGPNIVIVKHGPRGATVLSPEGEQFVPAHTVDVVEVVGAGDALASGFLFGLICGYTSRQCLEFGTTLAARAVQVTDDLPEVEPWPATRQD